MFKKIDNSFAYSVLAGGPIINIFTIGKDGIEDGMTAAWSCPFDPDVLLVVIDKTHTTAKNIRETKKLVIAPLAAIIPAAATSSALIYVGILMLGGLKKVDFEDLSQVAPVALMLIAMPISGSIGHGIGLGLITYTVLKVFTGKAKEVSILTYAISLLFLVKFFLVV